MRKLVLFSNPSIKIMDDIINLIFPDDCTNKSFAYMPADGGFREEEANKSFATLWEEVSTTNGYQFNYINNSADDPGPEAGKLEQAGVLLVTGGTCKLLANLRNSNLITAVNNFLNNKEFIYAGFSAGAMLLTPSFNLAKIEPFASEKNSIGIKDLSALGIIDFEIFPHFCDENRKFFDQYHKLTNNPVIPLSDNDYIVLNL